MLSSALGEVPRCGTPQRCWRSRRFGINWGPEWGSGPRES